MSERVEGSGVVLAWQNQEPMTPVEIERALTSLLNEIARNQLRLMNFRNEEVEARLAYERAHVQASTDPLCPKVERGGTTVAERDDWIRGVEFEEYEAFQRAKKSTENAKSYLDSLSTQASIVQTLAKSVITSYMGTQ